MVIFYDIVMRYAFGTAPGNYFILLILLLYYVGGIHTCYEHGILNNTIIINNVRIVRMCKTYIALGSEIVFSRFSMYLGTYIIMIFIWLTQNEKKPGNFGGTVCVHTIVYRVSHLNIILTRDISA